MWYSKPKQQAVSVDEYINRFTIRHAACDSTKVIEVDNIRFTMKAYYGYSVKIHLVDGEDELLVYDADYSGVKRGTWNHKASWCDKIHQIVLD
ncbi:hypothetical protein M5X02_32275, partial [Paenibacillus alvei]|uniref:hypothetical protein n=1 Tax=Paenibacillus alvei TaxID=44250 RepID=UPI002284DA6D